MLKTFSHVCEIGIYANGRIGSDFMVVIDDLLCFGEEEYESFPWMGLHCTLLLPLLLLLTYSGFRRKVKSKGGKFGYTTLGWRLQREMIKNPIDRRIMT